MGTLNWEVNDNHIPTAITVMLNRQSFQIISFPGRNISKKRKKKANFFTSSLFFMCCSQMDGWQFWFATDTLAILNSLLATYSCEQMDKEWIPQVENEPHRRIQNDVQLWISKLSCKSEEQNYRLILAYATDAVLYGGWGWWVIYSFRAGFITEDVFLLWSMSSIC